MFFCDSINLTPTEFRCLRYLLKEHFLQVKELALEMGLAPSRVTNLLNSLEKKGYILRTISDKDRRIININLTNEGKSFTKNVQDKYVKFHEDILLCVDDKKEIKDMFVTLHNFQTTLERFLKEKGEDRDGEKR